MPNRILFLIVVNKTHKSLITFKQKAMKKTLFLLIAIFPSLLSTAQSVPNSATPSLPNSTAQSPPKDSLYYVRLLDGSTIYSNKVRLVQPAFQQKYLLLDSNKRLPLSQVRDFVGWQGTFAVGNLGGRYDAFRLQNEGRRISLYSQCYYETETVFASTAANAPATATTITTAQKALYFRKGQNGDIEPLTYANLKTALSDNPASMQQLRVARTHLYLGIGLMAGGVALGVAGFIHMTQQSNNAQNAYKAASAAWFRQSMSNPNLPLPAQPAPTGISPLVYLGALSCLSTVIPLCTGGKHVQRALDIYNGIE
jgi:hypothetical protein